MGPNSQNVSSCYAITSQGGSPVVSGQGRADPMLTDSLDHFLVHHHERSMAYERSYCGHITARRPRAESVATSCSNDADP
jgi:hypothetical protein